MIATYINCLTVLIGSLLGLLFRKKIHDDLKSVIFASAGLISLLVGFSMALKTESYLIMLLSIALGGGIGYLLDIEQGFIRLGIFFERISSRRGPEVSVLDESKNFAKGFLDASILFCAGAMTIVGAINAGTMQDYELILIKSVMDGFMAIMFAAAYGPGVLFSIVTILIYQGGITLAAGSLAPLLGEHGLNGLSAVGGVLVMMIGFNLLSIKEFKTANFLPALLFVLLFTAISPWISEFYLSVIS
jgi:uncharacterized protein